MRRTVTTLAAALMAVAFAMPSLADAPTARDVQAAVDGYLADGQDAQLVGGPGSAGYDGGFWIRGGDFSLKINLTLQARYEYWDWDNEEVAENDAAVTNEGPFGGDLSGFSLPRATLKLSGTAPCNICYYMELEFGHFGRDAVEFADIPNDENLGASRTSQTYNFDNTREAWIEWCYCPSFNLRMGQVQLPGTRQAMVRPELQQFVDVGLVTSMSMLRTPGLTDRNRDHGVLVHGAFGCENEWSYMVSVTNGDGGDSVRNVLDPRTSDNLAYAARINWAFLKPIGYQEGALNFDTCSWYGEVGAYAFYYADRIDKPHRSWHDALRMGVDVALGYGGFSFTGALIFEEESDADGGDEQENTMWFAQLGYHFPGTAWEIAVRYGIYMEEADFNNDDEELTELAVGINYYLNGHGNKLQLDVTWIETNEEDDGYFIVYPGIHDGLADGDAGMLVRFQWQLAL